MSARLWTIETRRSVAIWLVPVLVAASWLLVRDNLALPVVLWVDASVEIGRSLIFVGPFVGGAAAWMAGRDRRRGMEELVGTTPRPPIVRDLALWGATAAWAAVAYALIAAYVGVLANVEATWGGPHLRPILVGLVAIFADAALGYAVGRYLPYRFTAPLVAIALFFLQVYLAWIVGYDRSSALGDLHEAIEPAMYLSPIADVDTSVWYGVWPDLAPPRLLWFAGLTALALAAVALRGARTAATWGAAVVALLLALGGGAWTVASAPNLPYGANDALFFAFDDPDFALEATMPDLVCSGATFDVCVHPAFEPWLTYLSGELNRLAAPLIGLEGVPMRAEQAPTNGRLLQEGEVVRFDLGAYPGSQFGATVNTLGCLVDDCAPRGQANRGPESWEAIEAVRLWLLRSNNEPFPYYGGPPNDPMYEAINRAADRFAALPAAEQRAWLDANIVALRAGELTLEDLP